MLGLSSINHLVRQGLHLRQVATPEAKAPGEAPSKLKQILHPLVVKNNPLAPAAPAAPHELKIMSFNVRLGGEKFQAVKKTVADGKADIVGLQECSRETAEKIAKDLGYHLTFYSSMRHNNSPENGKAILSRFPIKQAESKPFKIGIGTRLKSMWDRFKRSEGNLLERIAGTASLWQKRTILTSTFEINGKTIDFVDTHLTTGAPAQTAAQYEQHQAYVEDRKKRGHEVILTADFNTHFQRTSKSHPNDPSLKAWEKLQTSLTDAYDQAETITIKGLDGRELSPAEARKKLQAPGLSAEERDTLKRIAIGATLASGKGRIDTVMSTGGFEATKVSIDQQNAASDHEPVFATLAFKP